MLLVSLIWTFFFETDFSGWFPGLCPVMPLWEFHMQQVIFPGLHWVCHWIKLFSEKKKGLVIPPDPLSWRTRNLFVGVRKNRTSIEHEGGGNHALQSFPVTIGDLLFITNPHEGSRHRTLHSWDVLRRTCSCVFISKARDILLISHIHNISTLPLKLVNGYHPFSI